MSQLQKIQSRVGVEFHQAFGRTPLRQRLDDILGEAIELSRATDMKNMLEETGDLLASTLMLCEENGWDAQKLIESTLKKIELRKQQYNALGRKVKVAILGGAFDPPTLGHIRVAQFVLDSSREFDEIWLCPCAQHMYGKQMTSGHQRLEMCRIACCNDGRIRVFDYEIKNSLRGETYHFVKRLLEEPFAKNEYDFSIIIGLDNANTFSQWVNYEYLKDMIRFVVVSRQGVKRDERVNWYLKPPHIYLAAMDYEIPQTSSTTVRLAIASGSIDRIIGTQLDPEVAKYIQKNKLYEVVDETL